MKTRNININFQKSDKKVQAKRPFSFGERIEVRGFLFFLFSLFFFSGFAQEGMVKAEIDTTNIRIGEQFQLKISVDETQNVIIPKLRLNGLEVIDSTKVDTLKNSLIRRYILTGFDSGAFYIPQQQIFVKNRAYFTDSLLVNVATVAIDTTKVKKFPIKSIKKEPYTFDDFKIYFYILLAALAIIGFWIYWFVIRKRKEEIEAPTYRTLPPYEEAILRLSELDEKLLWQNNKVKEYYSELTEIVRGYIERELNVPALENTTDEVLEMIRDFKKSDTIQTSQDTLDKLRSLLREADLVKFAKSKPLALEIEEDRKDAQEIVSNLKPKPIIEENDELE
nr:BatD family protein [Polaribacter haliotis]